MTASDLSIATIDCAHEDAALRFAELRARLSPRGDVVSEKQRARTIELFGEPLAPADVVARICEDVRRDGIRAVLEYTRQLDRRELTAESLRVSADELEAAHAQVDKAFLETVRRVRHNIEQFQRSLLPKDVRLVRQEGAARVELRNRVRPLRRVGLCIPGGAAAYPSTVLMTAVPALTAGVPQVAVVVPPTEFGGFNREMLAVCRELGLTEVYRVGGAQAIAALAYGVEGIERVDKIAGPGNLFVALAKRYVYGEVDIDSIAGPSEIVVLADESARPEFVAADLIAQAEHSPGASILITWHRPLVESVRAAIIDQLGGLDRSELTRESLESFGALVTARDQDEAVRLAEMIAPEHLHIQARDPFGLADRIENAGAIFLGDFTPVALGDYVAGPSHVLPTGGTARFAGGLSSLDFVKRISLIQYNHEALQAVADDVRLLADCEGLTAHRASVDIRLR